jgi:hypothetical protein
MPLINLTEKEWIAMGNTWAGFECSNRTKEKTHRQRFRDFYGISPESCRQLFLDLQQRTKEKMNLNPLNYLMTLDWLKSYATEPHLAGRWKCDEDTVRKWIWVYVSKIQELKGYKIVWGNWGDKDDAVFILSVDGVHCRTYECRKDPSSKWYSHKHNGPGLTYELAIAICSNQLV